MQIIGRYFLNLIVGRSNFPVNGRRSGRGGGGGGATVEAPEEITRRQLEKARKVVLADRDRAPASEVVGCF
ncbi:hypothetical protein F2Q69_00050987 [Brassica cretica]|uniref:Uncharacterized protein n=1 Tax=Brassica cretica TaxID=69181 RepID=A0A8S9PVG0_BRACR|nr:hypothetical protein F2Q69_00050987 [Brassica cretica]